MSLNRQSKSFRITDGLLVEEGTENSGIEMKIEWGVPPPRRSKSSNSKKISSASSTTSSSTASSEADEVYALSSVVSNREVVEEVEDRTSAVCCVDSVYGKPKKTKEVREIMDVTLERAHMKGNEYDDGHECGVVDTSGEGGLVWKVMLIPNDYDHKFKTEKNKKKRDKMKRYYDEAKQCIKPRRGVMVVTVKDFFSSLTKIPDEKNKNSLKWVFSGVLNGWPGLTCLELLSIQYKAKFTPMWINQWNPQENKNDRYLPPTYPPDSSSLEKVIATVRSPPWSAYGWSKDSLGYFYWYERFNSPYPRLEYGSNVVKLFERERMMCSQNPIKMDENKLKEARCVKVSMVSHRYAKTNENIKDHFTYHSFALLEWDHHEYCTVAEVGFLNGLSGYMGRSNHIEDKDEPIPSLYKLFHPEMILPWKDTLSEIRCIDVPAKSLEDFLSFMKEYTGKDKRFLDVQVTFSHDVRLSFNYRDHIAQYLINYVRRGRTYSEIRRNCQTFAADFCAFLAGKKEVAPFHPINRIEYKNQAHFFLYDSSMYL